MAYSAAVWTQQVDYVSIFHRTIITLTGVPFDRLCLPRQSSV